MTSTDDFEAMLRAVFLSKPASVRAFSATASKVGFGAGESVLLLSIEVLVIVLLLITYVAFWERFSCRVLGACRVAFWERSPSNAVSRFGSVLGGFPCCILGSFARTPRVAFWERSLGALTSTRTPS